MNNQKKPTTNKLIMNRINQSINQSIEEKQNRRTDEQTQAFTHTKLSR
jgi:hypothetical protein